MTKIAILIDGGYFLKRLPFVRPDMDAADGDLLPRGWTRPHRAGKDRDHAGLAGGLPEPPVRVRDRSYSAFAGLMRRGAETGKGTSGRGFQPQPGYACRRRCRRCSDARSIPATSAKPGRKGPPVFRPALLREAERETRRSEGKRVWERLGTPISSRHCLWLWPIPWREKWCSANRMRVGRCRVSESFNMQAALRRIPVPEFPA